MVKMNELLNSLIEISNPMEARVEWYKKHGFTMAQARKMAKEEVKETRESVTMTIKKRKEEVLRKRNVLIAKRLNDVNNMQLD